MRIGFVGLGKMGSQIVQKLVDAQHEIIAFDVNHEAVRQVEEYGARGSYSREELVEALGDNPIIWLMIPAEFVHAEIVTFLSILPAGSTIIDGGNSDYRGTMERAKLCEEKSVDFIDIGTSGGIMGLQNGFSMMVGGSKTSFHKIEPILDVLSKPSGSYDYFGPNGYGHYVKMIHNGVEYAIMQAYAEGYDLLKYGPLENIDLAAVAKTWQNGSIISSKLNDLILAVLKENPELDGIEGYVAESGEGQWTSETAAAANVPMPALQSALKVRESSRNGKVFFATKLLAAMRNAFGGHTINK